MEKEVAMPFDEPRQQRGALEVEYGGAGRYLHLGCGPGGGNGVSMDQDDPVGMEFFAIEDAVRF